MHGRQGLQKPQKEDKKVMGTGGKKKKQCKIKEENDRRKSVHR